jgi:hypothetical protein
VHGPRQIKREEKAADVIKLRVLRVIGKSGGERRD